MPASCVIYAVQQPFVAACHLAAHARAWAAIYLAVSLSELSLPPKPPSTFAVCWGYMQLWYMQLQLSLSQHQCICLTVIVAAHPVPGPYCSEGLAGYLNVILLLL